MEQCFEVQMHFLLRVAAAMMNSDQLFHWLLGKGGFKKKKKL